MSAPVSPACEGIINQDLQLHAEGYIGIEYNAHLDYHQTLRHALKQAGVPFFKRAKMAKTGKLWTIRNVDKVTHVSTNLPDLLEQASVTHVYPALKGLEDLLTGPFVDRLSTWMTLRVIPRKDYPSTMCVRMLDEWERKHGSPFPLWAYDIRLQPTFREEVSLCVFDLNELVPSTYAKLITKNKLSMSAIEVLSAQDQHKIEESIFQMNFSGRSDVLEWKEKKARTAKEEMLSHTRPLPHQPRAKKI